MRAVSDTHLRTLERQAASGDLEALGKLALERIRTGGDLRSLGDQLTVGDLDVCLTLGAARTRIGLCPWCGTSAKSESCCCRSCYSNHGHLCLLCPRQGEGSCARPASAD